MPGIRKIVHMRFQVVLVNIEIEFVGGGRITLTRYIVIIPIVSTGSNHVPLVIKYMFPFE